MNSYPTFHNYSVFLYCWAAVGIGAGLYLLKRAAPYGRYSSDKWGPMISNRIAWLLMEATVLVAFFAWLRAERYQLQSPESWMIALFVLHYLHRSFIYPFMIRTNGKKMPLVIMLSAMLFNTVNGSALGAWFALFAAYPPGWLASPAFTGGLCCFIAGLVINWTADYHLIGLRKKGETGYKIPEGGLFNYISSPNLLGEILEWGGYALLTWSLPGLVFFIWTCANLAPRALANQRWYRQQFPGYPPGRKALIPFIW